jgi:hypothetical protein
MSGSSHPPPAAPGGALVPGGAGPEPVLAEAALAWLGRQLAEQPDAPLVPISALEQALARQGATFRSATDAPPDAADLLRRARRRLFPPGRVKALHRWLRTLTAEGAGPADAAAATAALESLRRVDPLGPAGGAHPVLQAVLEASLDAASGFPELRRLLAHVAASAWPAGDPAPLAGPLRVLRWIPVRVAAIDLLPALRAERARHPVRARSGAADGERQLPLIDAAARPLAPAGRLGRAARDATADALDRWLAASNPGDDARALARALRDRLRGGPGDDDAVEALVRASTVELPERASAAELTRLEAALVAAPHDVGPLLELGDYLARALRNDESVRAYQAARALAPPTERPRIDERIAGREERLAGPTPRRRREPPEQIPLRLS